MTLNRNQLYNALDKLVAMHSHGIRGDADDYYQNDIDLFRYVEPRQEDTGYPWPAQFLGITNTGKARLRVEHIPGFHCQNFLFERTGEEYRLVDRPNLTLYEVFCMWEDLSEQVTEEAILRKWGISI